MKKTAAEIQTRDQAAAFEFGLFKAAKALKMSKTAAMELYNTALRKFARKLSKQAALTMPSTPGGTLEQMQSATPMTPKVPGSGFLNQLQPKAPETMGGNFFRQMQSASPTPQAQAPAPTPPPVVPPVRPAWTPSFQTAAPKVVDPNAFTDETADTMAAAPKPDIMEEGVPLAAGSKSIDMNYEGAGGALTPGLVQATNNAAAARGAGPVYGTR